MYDRSPSGTSYASVGGLTSQRSMRANALKRLAGAWRKLGKSATAQGNKISRRLDRLRDLRAQGKQALPSDADLDHALTSFRTLYDRVEELEAAIELAYRAFHGSAPAPAKRR